MRQSVRQTNRWREPSPIESSEPPSRCYLDRRCLTSTGHSRTTGLAACSPDRQRQSSTPTVVHSRGTQHRTRGALLDSCAHGLGPARCAQGPRDRGGPYQLAVTLAAPPRPAEVAARWPGPADLDTRMRLAVPTSSLEGSARDQPGAHAALPPGGAAPFREASLPADPSPSCPSGAFGHAYFSRSARDDIGAELGVSESRVSQMRPEACTCCATA